MKKILSILVSVALLASACSLFFTAAAEDTDANTFKAQHLDIDFSNYTMNQGGGSNLLGYNGVPKWEIKTDDALNNKYLSFSNVNAGSALRPGISAFILSSDGTTNSNFANGSGKYFELFNGGVYRLSLNYRLTTTDDNDSLHLSVISYKASTKGDTAQSRVVNSSNEVVADGTTSSLGIYQDITSVNGKANNGQRGKLDKTSGDEWATATIIFKVDTVESWKNALALQLRSGLAKTAGIINCDIDDIQVDRLATVNVNGVASYKIAPPCERDAKTGQYLFSGTENFAGDTDIRNIINGKVEVYGEGATAEVTKEGALYSDLACTTEITDAAGLFATARNNGVYNCYQKINTEIGDDQFAFVGFDEEPKLRNSKFTDSEFVNSWNNNSGFSIVNNEAYTGNSSLKFEKNDASGSQKLYIGNGYEYEVGKGYKISFYTKRVYNNTTAYEISAFAGNGFDETEQCGTKSVTVTPSKDWTRYEIIYYLGDDVKNATDPTEYYAPGLMLSDNASSLYIDAITISEYKKEGDVNGDKEIDICDLVGINEYINNDSYRMIEDNAKPLNGNGTIDADTLSVLRNILLG